MILDADSLTVPIVVGTLTLLLFETVTPFFVLQRLRVGSVTV